MSSNNTGALLILQAYERMVTFATRNGLTALSDRISGNDINAHQLADVYIASIQAEFEHNLSQQIYLPENTWQVISDMKDQQVFILRQLKLNLPENAPASSLVNMIQTYLQADPNASLQPMVLEMLKREARQLLLSSQKT